ncbi:MAG TPA: anti-phage dCTP deaminase [Gemmatimonadaceae bacterium]|nr:anti-phage dCTP deaminase [Gemmatimonadaceae bacterium]
MSAVTVVTAKEGASGSAKPTGVDLRSWHTPELVIALCGPIGSPLHDVAAKLEEHLDRTHGYKCRTIRLSKFIDDIQGAPPAGASPFEKAKWRIDKGNALREKFGASVLADLAIRQIANQRERSKPEESKEYKPDRVCHIIDSIKNREELETLRLVYRDLLFTVGVFGSLQAREANLRASRMELSEVYQLIDRDSGEEKDFGQTVREIFPRADYFVRVDGDSAASMDSRLERLLSLLFDLRVTTPTVAETGMYHAAAAARNSACLSRQVGAAIVDDDGRLISIGWNDVPCFGGSVYRLNGSAGDRENDHRCYNLKSRCESDRERFEIAERTVDAIVSDLASQGIAMTAAKKDRLVNVVLKSSIGSLLEFSRALHAEMHAILSAAVPVRNTTLYCTTYPCHPCARFITAAGIKEVRYIEPYRKSLAIKLHGDAMCEDEKDKTKVRILPFDGVAPTRYLELFGMSENSRKDETGAAYHRAASVAPPKCESTLESLPVMEGLVVAKLAEKKVPTVSAQSGATDA